MSGRRRVIVVRLLQVVMGLCFLGLWQLLVVADVFGSFSLSGPAKVWSTLEMWFSTGTVWEQLLVTFVVLVVGCGAGVLVGVVMGVASGVSRTARAYFDSFVAFGNAVPKLILIPFFIAAFGFGELPGIIITGLSVVFLTSITIEAALLDIGDKYVDHARLLGASRLRLITSVFLPGIGVWIVSTARLSVGLAFQSAVVSEFFGATKGLGSLLSHGEQTFDSAEIFAAVVLTAAMAFLVDALLGIADARIGRKTGVA